MGNKSGGSPLNYYFIHLDSIAVFIINNSLSVLITWLFIDNGHS